MAAVARPYNRDGFEIAIICALSIERDAIEALLDEEYEKDGFSYGKEAMDSNAYTTGRLGNQHIVLAYMPGMGMIKAAAVASNIRFSFRGIKVCIVVGICGGVPTAANGVEITLGDVIISTSVVQIDFGRQYPNQFIRKASTEDTLGRANPDIQSFIGKLSGHLVLERLLEKTSIYTEQISTRQGFSNTLYPGPEKDQLYPAEYRHKHWKQGLCSICDRGDFFGDDICEDARKKSCVELGCDKTQLVNRKRLQKALGIRFDGCQVPAAETKEAQKAHIHFGRIACSNQVMKSGQHRDRIAQLEGVIGFEMESAGSWDYIPTIVIKSVCDYSDSHKKKDWQEYAAATAAACTKAVLEEWRSIDNPMQGTAGVSLGPTILIPFRRDTDFVHRVTLLDQIHERSSVLGSRTALVGLGGVGEQSPDMWVFWVHASNSARFEQGYQEIASLVKLPDRKNPHANIFKLVHDWLYYETQRRWVLVLDNVDNAEFLTEPYPMVQKNDDKPHNSLRLLDYIPQSPNGSILITTRTRSAALRLVEETEIIPVDPMSEADTITLLEKKLGPQANREDLAALAQELEFMPLAIVQAAGYIAARAPRCSIQQYISKLQKSDKERTILLNHEGGHLRRDREAKNSIIITWQISFDHIRDTRPSAADLLSLMSFFDRQGIPEALLRDQSVIDGAGPHPQQAHENHNEEQDNDDDKDDSKSTSSVNEKFEDDILILKGYSFISINMDTSTFGMHRLVQLSMRTWLAAHGQLEPWRRRFIRNLGSEFPILGEHENWKICEALFPHAKVAIEQQPQGEVPVLEWASLVYSAAWYAYRRGRVADATEMAIKSMEAREERLGPEHVRTLESTEILILAYQLAGRWQAVEEMQVQLVETSKRVLGLDHLLTMRSMNNLIEIFLSQGRHKEAEELGLQVVELKSRVLGLEHRETLTGMRNLASVYQCQPDRWKEAEELMVQVVEISKRVLGPEHPDTLISIGNLALSYSGQGRLKEAEELTVQIVGISERILGPEHPDTLIHIGNLALSYCAQGRLKEAEELMVQVMEIGKRVLGPEHPQILTSIGNLAFSYCMQGRLKEAEELELRVMETRKRVLGQEHPSTLIAVENLACTLKGQGRYVEAINLMAECAQLRIRVLGADDPRSIRYRTILAEWARL